MAKLRGLSTIGDYLAEKSQRSIARIAYDALKDRGMDAIAAALGPAGAPISAVLRSILKMEKVEERQETRKNRKLWRQQRIDWLRENQWRFDWRSQPRRPAGTEAGGEWLPGRLDYMAEQKAPLSRKQRQALGRHRRWVKSNQKANAAFKARRNIQSSFASK